MINKGQIERKEKTIEQRVADLHREGWHAVNIASISHIKVERVNSILRNLNITD